MPTWRTIESRTLRQQLGKYAPSSEKLENGHFCLLPLCWALVYSHEKGTYTPAPVKNCFFDCCGPVRLVNRSPTGYQSQVFRGPVLWAASAKAGNRPVYKILLGRYPQLAVCYWEKVGKVSLGFLVLKGISQPEPRLVQFRSLTLRQRFSKYANEPISKKEWEMSQSGCFLCTESWGYCMPMNHCFFILL